MRVSGHLEKHLQHARLPVDHLRQKKKKKKATRQRKKATHDALRFFLSNVQAGGRRFFFCATQCVSRGAPQSKWQNTGRRNQRNLLVNGLLYVRSETKCQETIDSLGLPGNPEKSWTARRVLLYTALAIHTTQLLIVLSSLYFTYILYFLLPSPFVLFAPVR